MMSVPAPVIEEAASGSQRGVRFSCSGCGNCCHLRIPVNDRDVARILAETGLALDEVVEFVRPAEFRGEPDHLAFVWFGPRRSDRRVMCLRESGGHCRFLTADRRCAIYSCRPVVCRSHPFVLEASACGRRIEALEMNYDCDCAATRGAVRTEAELITLDRWSAAEDSRYGALVARWNRSRRRRTEARFLEYVGMLPPQA
jgi:Fe-S-cluster containining protein